jgi:uncharacterized protein YajQ (UPF0234 family)
MFQYVKFNEGENFRVVGVFEGKVHSFSVSAVAVEGTIEEVNALVALQGFTCTVITQDEFKALVSDSLQLKRIREVVASKIAEKYRISDELAMGKRSVTDAKRVAYEAYVKECIAVGDALKVEIGY